VLGFCGLLLTLTRVPLIRRALIAPGAQQRLLWQHSFRAAGIVVVATAALAAMMRLQESAWELATSAPVSFDTDDAKPLQR
jgi:hypothetical protein